MAPHSWMYIECKCGAIAWWDPPWNKFLCKLCGALWNASARKRYYPRAEQITLPFDAPSDPHKAPPFPWVRWSGDE